MYKVLRKNKDLSKEYISKTKTTFSNLKNDLKTAGLAVTKGIILKNSMQDGYRVNYGSASKLLYLGDKEIEG